MWKKEYNIILNYIARILKVISLRNFPYLSPSQAIFLLHAHRHISASLACIVCLLLLLLCASTSAQAQNTKGDRPARESRFATKKKKPLKLFTKNKKPASRISGERAGKPIRPVYQSRPSSTDVIRADNPKRKRVTVRSVSASQSRNNVYTNRSNPFVSNYRRQPPKSNERLFSAKTYRNKVITRSATARISKQKNYTPNGGSFRNYRSPIVQKPVNNRTTVKRLQKAQSKTPYQSKRKVLVVPRSASRNFIRTKSINPYAGFFRIKRKGEQATDKDIAGRTLRTKNFSTPPIGLVELEKDPYKGRKRNGGDRAYPKGPINGFALSATKTQPKAWNGDIAGRKVRGRNYQSKVYTGSSIPLPKPGRAVVGDKRRFKGFFGLGRSRTQTGKVGTPIPARGPGASAGLIAKFQQKLNGRKSASASLKKSRQGWNNYGQPLPPRQVGAGSRGNLFSGNSKANNRPLKGGGSVSGKIWNNRAQPLSPRGPGIGGRGINYAGNLRANKPLKGGGSVSRKWNNNGQPIAPRAPGIGSRGAEYSGTIKMRRPLKGGGSVSGKRWNNNGQSLPGRPLGNSAKASVFAGNVKRFALKPGMSNQGENFAGFTKASKPIKGGGSVSARNRNNNSQPISPRAPGIGSKNVNYSGNIKGGKPLKGGGSVSGKLWNNNQQPISPRAPGIGIIGINYAGFIKTGKPIKGGGSVSGKLWNNNNTPIPVRTPPDQAAKIATYKGSNKKFEIYPSMSNQGEEFTGFLKRGKYSRTPYQHEKAIVKREKSNYFSANGIPVRLKQPGWARNKNANENALLKRDPGSSVFAPNGLQIRVQTPGYKRNKNAAENALVKRKPLETVYKAGGITTRMKQPGWARNKNAHEDALLKRDPSTSVFATGKIYGKIRAYSYKSNPSSAREALRVREPGKAFVKASSYQGNIKMKKFDFLKNPNYHPDSHFVKNNKNNVKEERGFFTNLRLLWAKWFRKNQTQPDAVKEKPRKPRYDKREIGIWYD